MTFFGRVLRTARTWRSSTPLRQSLILLRARSHLTFHFLLAVSATAVLSTNFIPILLRLRIRAEIRSETKGCVWGSWVCSCVMFSRYADAAEFEVFHESVKRRDLSIQSTDTALANALNGSYLDSNDIGISKPALCTIPGAVEGRKVSIKIQIPATCDAARLIANIASDLGLIYVFLPYFSY